jgi:hypothetical protein
MGKLNSVIEQQASTSDCNPDSLASVAVSPNPTKADPLLGAQMTGNDCGEVSSFARMEPLERFETIGTTGCYCPRL